MYNNNSVTYLCQVLEVEVCLQSSMWNDKFTTNNAREARNKLLKYEAQYTPPPNGW